MQSADELSVFRNLKVGLELLCIFSLMNSITAYFKKLCLFFTTCRPAYSLVEKLIVHTWDFNGVLWSWNQWVTAHMLDSERERKARSGHFTETENRSKHPTQFRARASSEPNFTVRESYITLVFILAEKKSMFYTQQSIEVIEAKIHPKTPRNPESSKKQRQLIISSPLTRKENNCVST